MRTLATLVTTTLLAVFLATPPAYPQDDTKPDAKAGQQQDEKNKNKAEKDKAASPDEGKPAQEQPAVRPDERKNDERKPENRQPAASQPQEQRPAREMNRGREQHQAQRGKRIPDDKFRASFGHQHTFRVQRTQIVNSPQPTIVYGGYSFVFVDAWPVAWGFDDPVFIDFVDDEYFLFDPLYPGVRVALVVVE